MCRSLRPRACGQKKAVVPKPLQVWSRPARKTSGTGCRRRGPKTHSWPRKRKTCKRNSIIDLMRSRGSRMLFSRSGDRRRSCSGAPPWTTPLRPHHHHHHHRRHRHRPQRLQSASPRRCPPASLRRCPAPPSRRLRAAYLHRCQATSKCRAPYPASARSSRAVVSTTALQLRLPGHRFLCHRPATNLHRPDKSSLTLHGPLAAAGARTKVQHL
mmetsp:Transcript_59154/g.141250  ORF Transcript_59154/g.141250 Transcript_59154/m.141250 type:complete len:213 (+) Transcript_59154:999-1637(+)